MEAKSITFQGVHGVPLNQDSPKVMRNGYSPLSAISFTAASLSAVGLQYRKTFTVSLQL